MNVGLPGTGLGGLFYLLTALLMPLVELIQTLRGRTAWRRWLVALQQAGLAAGILSGLWATGFLLRRRLATTITHLPAASRVQAAGFASTIPTFFTIGLLLAMLTVVEIIGLFATHYNEGRVEPRSCP